MTNHIPELLAPAGNLHTGLAALKNGADAVYAGLQRFNARERGANFTHADMARLIDAAAGQGKKVYVAFNTLLKESELEDAAESLAELSLLRPDAVIVQDLAVLRMLRKHLPDIPVHASTQMGVHNSAAAELVAEMGISRVILERQLTLSEVREITRKSPIETEVFVHGALCCSLSGMCLFSSWMGGWSGNRGKCKQPCRRRYCSDDGNGFFFSPKDLYTLDLISDFCGAGVSSLKIEGRLKPAQYVVDAVRAYRLMLDTPPDERPKQLKEARRILAGALGRKWSHGFYDEDAGRQVVQHDALGGTGRLVGKVKKVERGGFVAEAIQTIRQSDRVRIQPASGDEGPGLIVNSIRHNGRSSSILKRGERGFIGFSGAIPAGGLIFKTGYASEANGLGKDASGPAPELRVDLDVMLSPDGIIAKIKTPLFAAEWRKDLEIPPASKRPLSHEKIADEFAKVPPPGIGVHAVSARCDGELFLAFAELREIRREFWDWAAEHVLPWADAVHEREVFRQLRGECAAPLCIPEAARRLPETVVLCDADACGNAGQITARPVAEIDGPDQEAVLPEFCIEAQLPALDKEIRRAIEQGCRRFRVTSLYGLKLLRDHDDLMISAGFPLPVANSMAAKELHEYGVLKASAWVELDHDAIMDLAAKTDGFLEIMRRSHVPLLTTRAHVPVDGPITDARGGEFCVVAEEVLTRLYPAQPLELPAIPNLHEFLDQRRLIPAKNTKPSNFNYDREWQ